MRSVEIDGESIDEAIERALHALGAAREEVQIDILENAQRGLLWLGRRRARVRATMRGPLGSWDGDTAVAQPQRPARDDETAGGTPRTDARTMGRPSTDSVPSFDAAAFLIELLRRMGLPGHVDAATDATTATLTVLPADPASGGALQDDVLRALALVVARVAERQTGDRRRVTVVLDGDRRPSDGGSRQADRGRTRGAHASAGQHRGRRR